MAESQVGEKILANHLGFLVRMVVPHLRQVGVVHHHLSQLHVQRPQVRLGTTAQFVPRGDEFLTLHTQLSLKERQAREDGAHPSEVVSDGAAFHRGSLRRSPPLPMRRTRSAIHSSVDAPCIPPQVGGILPDAWGGKPGGQDGHGAGDGYL